MGLDMYLSARKYINKIDWDKMKEDSERDYARATTDKWKNIVDVAGLSHIADVNDIYGVNVSVNAAYWRKANQIHNWFVENVQEGQDNCREYYVSNEKLRELLDLCKKSYVERNPELLPPREGFFFGGYDIDQYYWEDIQDTITQLSRLTELPDFEDLSFYYQSSW